MQAASRCLIFWRNKNACPIPTQHSTGSDSSNLVRTNILDRPALVHEKHILFCLIHTQWHCISIIITLEKAEHCCRSWQVVNSRHSVHIRIIPRSYFTLAYMHQECLLFMIRSSSGSAQWWRHKNWTTSAILVLRALLARRSTQARHWWRHSCETGGEPTADHWTSRKVREHVWVGGEHACRFTSKNEADPQQRFP